MWSLELPPSFRGPREEIGVRGEIGSPGPGFDWLRWPVFRKDSLTSLERVYVWGWPHPYAAILCCLLADEGESDGCDRGSEAAESIYRWRHFAAMSSVWIISNSVCQNLKNSQLRVTRFGLHEEELLSVSSHKEEDILSQSFIEYFQGGGSHKMII